MSKAYQSSSYVDQLLSKLPNGFSESTLYKKCIEKRIGKKRLKSISSQGIGFNEIPFSTPLTEIPEKFLTDVLNFVGYINETKSKTFGIKGVKLSTGEETEKNIPYVHRWTSIYRMGLLAKLYQLEEYLGKNVSDVTMITLTVYQRGFDPEQCLLNLMDNYKKLLDIMRHKFNKNSPIDYFYILEPHETGYPHMHIMYMRALSDDEKNWIKDRWSSKYGAGSFDHGINFSDAHESDNGFFKSGSIARVRGYLMKYLTKGLFSDKKHFYEIGGRKVYFNMPLHELLFNSLLKKHKIRLWNCSRHFSKVMKREEKDLSDWECTEVSQYHNDELINVIWSNEGGIRPDFIWIWKHFCSWVSKPLGCESFYDSSHYKIEYDNNSSLWVAYERVCVPVSIL